MVLSVKTTEQMFKYGRWMERIVFSECTIKGPTSQTEACDSRRLNEEAHVRKPRALQEAYSYDDGYALDDDGDAGPVCVDGVLPGRPTWVTCETEALGAAIGPYDGGQCAQQGKEPCAQPSQPEAILRHVKAGHTAYQADKLPEAI